MKNIHLYKLKPVKDKEGLIENKKFLNFLLHARVLLPIGKIFFAIFIKEESIEEKIS
jgi:hypothetical protein